MYEVPSSDLEGLSWQLPFHVGMYTGDLGDLVPALEPKKRVEWETLDASDVEGILASQGHCSALVKVTGNYSDIFLAHSSWFTYRCAGINVHGCKLTRSLLASCACHVEN